MEKTTNSNNAVVLSYDDHLFHERLFILISNGYFPMEGIFNPVLAA